MNLIIYASLFSLDISLRYYELFTSWIYTGLYWFSLGYVRVVYIITTYIYTDYTSLHDILYRICIMGVTLFYYPLFNILYDSYTSLRFLNYILILNSHGNIIFPSIIFSWLCYIFALSFFILLPFFRLSEFFFTPRFRLLSSGNIPRYRL